VILDVQMSTESHDAQIAGLIRGIEEVSLWVDRLLGSLGETIYPDPAVRNGRIIELIEASDRMRVEADKYIQNTTAGRRINFEIAEGLADLKIMFQAMQAQEQEQPHREVLRDNPGPGGNLVRANEKLKILRKNIDLLIPHLVGSALDGRPPEKDNGCEAGRWEPGETGQSNK
jgi:hypothetical protein